MPNATSATPAVGNIRTLALVGPAAAGKTGKLGRFGFRIVLTQGLNRQIRLMAAHFGYRVKQLHRARIGSLKLGHLKPGQWRNLSDAELRSLLPEQADW